MRKQQKDQLDVGLRCATFARNHPDADPTLTTASAALDGLNDRGEMLAGRFEWAMHQWSAAIEGKARAHQEALRLLGAIQRIADYAAIQQPEVAVRFHMPGTRSGRHDFAARVRAVTDLITTHRDLLAGYGMPAAMPEELGATLARYDDFTVRKAAAQQLRSATRRELREVARQVMQEVRHLDGLYRLRYTDQPELLIVWGRARRLPASSHDASEEEPAA